MYSKVPVNREDKTLEGKHRRSNGLLLLAAGAIVQLLRVLGVLGVASSVLLRVGDGAGAADSLILDVVEGAEELAVGAVHVRLVAGQRDAVEDVGRLVEDAVHLLQGTHGGLWEAEVDDGDDGGITGRC